MHRRRQHPLRRVLAPLGAVLAIALLTGLLVSRLPLDRDGQHVVPVAQAQGGDGAARAGAVKAASAVVTRRTPVVSPSGRYKFLLVQPDGSAPIRWNPCRPLHVKYSLDPTVPVAELKHVRAAFAQAGRALGGMQFVDDGTTDVVPNGVDDAARAGADVVFAFARAAGGGPRSSALLTGWEAGRGGFAAAGPRQEDGSVVQAPTHGSVVVDVDKWRTMTRHQRDVLYLHEIGHLVGLDHPKDGRQIMTSGAYDLPARYQKGDLQALSRLGRQAGCSG